VKTILFIGSHLSKEKGTKSASENVAELLEDIYTIKLSSQRSNLVLRLFDIVKDSIFYDYEIIHIDIYSGKALLYAKIASVVAKFRNKKIIMNLHGGRLHERYTDDSSKFEFFKLADKLISPSNFLSTFFISNFFNVEVITNYIDQRNFPYQRENYQRYSLLWIRAFNDIYQPELAINIVNVLKEKYPEVHLTMIGPDKGSLKSSENLIKRLNLKKYISILGKVPNQNLYQYFHSHAVYLNTTKYESFGLAVLEAASCGIPIVSTRVGEIVYIWKENEEVMMADSNETEFVEKVSLIFDSFDLSDKLSENAYKKAETFDRIRIKAKWVNLFENI